MGNAVTRNNLTRAIKTLGGRSISVSDAAPNSIQAISTTLKKAGFSGTGKLAPCIESAPNAPGVTWDQLVQEEILFHQAKLLRESRVWDFSPELDQPVSADDAVALRFVHAIAFGSSIPLVLVRTMLAQLERPLLYTHECIQWNFKKARWEHITPTEDYEFMEDPSVHQADAPRRFEEENQLEEEDQDECWFDADQEYFVEKRDGRFRLSHRRVKDEDGSRRRILKHGTKVEFKK